MPKEIFDIKAVQEDVVKAKNSNKDGRATVMVRGGSYTIDGPMVQERLNIFRFITSSHFDTAIVFVIVANAITIGCDLSFQLEDRVIDKDNPWATPGPYTIHLLEHVFLVVYVVELGLRFFALGLRAFRDNWMKFDFTLVVSGVVTNWILDPLVDTGVIVGSDAELSNITVLRMMRLLRVARTVRLLVKFRDLWVLVRSLINSAGIIVYSIFLLVIVLYIFGCVGVELVTKHSANIGPEPVPEFQRVVLEHFSSVPLTMLTLVQFVCLDSIGPIYRPLVKHDPWLTIYFMGSVVVLGIVLMNLITAVIVNGAVEQAQNDKETIKIEEDTKRKKFIKDLKRMFHRLDEDKSGTVSREEIMGLNEEDKTMIYGAIMIGNPLEIFDALDVDDSNSLEIEEFCDGIWQVAISKGPIEMKRMDKQMRILRSQLGNLRSQIKSVHSVTASTQFLLHQLVETMPSGFASGPPGQLQSSRRISTSSGESLRSVFCGPHEEAESDGSPPPMVEEASLAPSDRAFGMEPPPQPTGADATPPWRAPLENRPARLDGALRQVAQESRSRRLVQLEPFDASLRRIAQEVRSLRREMDAAEEGVAKGEPTSLSCSPGKLPAFPASSSKCCEGSTPPAQRKISSQHGSLGVGCVRPQSNAGAGAAAVAVKQSATAAAATPPWSNTPRSASPRE